MIKILLAEDHTLMREGLRSLLSMDPEFKVIGEASNGEEAVSLADRLNPDLIIMDIAMPILNGIEATRKIKERHPEIKILILTQYDSQKYLFKVLQVGASGYVLKLSASTELVSAIKTVYEGLAYLTPHMTQVLICDRLSGDSASFRNDLTARENEILKLIAEGMTSQEIAETLSISLKTVQTHRTHILKKLDLHDRTELVKYAIAKGIIAVEEPAT